MKPTLSLMGKIFAGTLAAGCFAAIVAASISVSVADSGRIVKGVTSMGTELSGMTRSEARAFFENAVRVRETPVVLQYGQARWTLSPEDTHMSVDIDAAIEEAMSCGRGDTLIRNMESQIRCAREGHDIELAATYDSDALMAKLSAVAAAIDTQPANAYVTLQSDGSIGRVAGIIGRKLDTETLAQTLGPAIEGLSLPEMVELTPKDVPPYVTDADLAAIDSVLGVYTTRFAYGDRGDNIVLAAGHLNGILIRSGQGFSFNEAVGQRTASAGYRTAGVILDGRMAQDVGGGVCQVSTTLYNAILLAGLTSTERSPHSFPSSYCPPGRDATVADGLLDFRFMNPLPHNVYLISATYGNTLAVYVLGTRADLNGNTIKIENSGSAMRPVIYRVYERDGQVVEREYLHTDAYASPL